MYCVFLFFVTFYTLIYVGSSILYSKSLRDSTVISKVLVKDAFLQCQEEKCGCNIPANTINTCYLFTDFLVAQATGNLYFFDFTQFGALAFLSESTSMDSY